MRDGEERARLVIVAGGNLGSWFERMLERDGRFDTCIRYEQLPQRGLPDALDLIVIDAAHIDEDAGIVASLHTAHPKAKIFLLCSDEESPSRTLAALSEGATDCLRVPSSLEIETKRTGGFAHRISQALLAVLPRHALSTLAANKLSPPHPPRTRKSSRVESRRPMRVALPKRKRRRANGRVVAIGSSTGGPDALAALLAQLPANLPAAILIAQHMPREFTKALAERLDRVCPLTVVEAEHGQVVRSGQVYIAPGGKHMGIVHLPLTGTRISLDEETPLWTRVNPRSTSSSVALPVTTEEAASPSCSPAWVMTVKMGHENYGKTVRR